MHRTRKLKMEPGHNLFLNPALRALHDGTTQVWVMYQGCEISQLDQDGEHVFTSFLFFFLITEQLFISIVLSVSPQETRRQSSLTTVMFDPH